MHLRIFKMQMRTTLNHTRAAGELIGALYIIIAGVCIQTDPRNHCNQRSL